METQTAELLDYNEVIDPIEGEETYEDTDLEDDLHEIQVNDDLGEPDAEDADLDLTELPDEDEDELLDEDDE